jgi:hypothetical protein
MTRTQIRDHFHKNKGGTDIGRALGVLHRQKLAEMRQEDTGGRRTERWYALRGTTETTQTTEATSYLAIGRAALPASPGMAVVLPAVPMMDAPGLGEECEHAEDVIHCVCEDEQWDGPDESEREDYDLEGVAEAEREHDEDDYYDGPDESERDDYDLEGAAEAEREDDEDNYYDGPDESEREDDYYDGPDESERDDYDLEGADGSEREDREDEQWDGPDDSERHDYESEGADEADLGDRELEGPDDGDGAV